METKDKKVAETLGKIFDNCREGLRESVSKDEYDRLRYDFVFHMMDWEDDLNKLRTFFDKPEAQSTDDATEMLIGILYHLIPHMTTAGTLLLDRVPNPFAGAQQS